VAYAFFFVTIERRMYHKMIAENPLIPKNASNGIQTMMKI
jgi:hypothetical protein